MFDNREKVIVFIDGAHFYFVAKSLDFEIDFQKVLAYFKSEAYLVRANYYTAIAEDQEFIGLRPLVDWLDYNGYRVVTKAYKDLTDPSGKKRVRSSMEMELACDLFEQIDTADHLIIIAGDSDLARLVQTAQLKGKKVTVMSTLTGQLASISDELRRKADQFVDLSGFKEKFSRSGHSKNRS
ncbi:NYN domain-containing protein [Rhizobium sp. RU20A]|uniref:LabA-like NYN domain-containing protein n=1 Tax=Rhizobium sp. RU20A TaxID=1907412 RepID=UPI00165FE568|nr:NYN domain-containing protein [Rhizobium sp. RU20A]